MQKLLIAVLTPLYNMLIEKGYKLTKEFILKLVADFKARKRIKECTDEDDPIKRSECLNRELNDK
jgi:hypothetical protein